MLIRYSRRTRGTNTQSHSRIPKRHLHLSETQDPTCICIDEHRKSPFVASSDSIWYHWAVLNGAAFSHLALFDQLDHLLYLLFSWFHSVCCYHISCNAVQCVVVIILDLLLVTRYLISRLYPSIAAPKGAVPLLGGQKFKNHWNIATVFLGGTKYIRKRNAGYTYTEYAT